MTIHTKVEKILEMQAKISAIETLIGGGKPSGTQSGVETLTMQLEAILANDKQDLKQLKNDLIETARYRLYSTNCAHSLRVFPDNYLEKIVFALGGDRVNLEKDDIQKLADLSQEMLRIL